MLRAAGATADLTCRDWLGRPVSGLIAHGQAGIGGELGVGYGGGAVVVQVGARGHFRP